MATPEDLDRVRAVVEEHPELNDNGWGTNGFEYAFRGRTRSQFLAESRAALCTEVSLTEVVMVEAWMVENLRPTLGIGRAAPSSYALKHVAEQAMTDLKYVSNGQLITAALAAGVYKVELGDRVNPRIGVYLADVRVAREG